MVDSLEAFKKRQESLAAALERAAELLDELGNQGTAGGLRDQAKGAREFRFKIAVVGEFSSGKSTLLNGFLGAELLPAKMPPCTAAPVSISFGEPRKLLVHRTGNRTKEQPFTDLPGLVMLKSNREEDIARERASSDLERIEVLVPLEICRNGVTFFDTPGLNEASSRTEITLSLLPQVDAAIVLMTAMHLLSKSERDFLEAEAAKQPEDRRWMNNAFVAVTFADVAAADGGLEELRARLDQFCDAIGASALAPRRRYFIDAKSYLNNAIGKNATTDGMEFRRLTQDLSDFLLRERGAAGWQSQLLSAQRGLSRAKALIEAEAASQEQDAEKVRAAAAQAKRALTTERTRLEGMSKGLRKMGKRFAKELANEFRVEGARWASSGIRGYLESQVYPESVILNVKKPAKWYSERATEWLTTQQQHWANQTPKERLAEFLSEFEEAYRDDLAEMKKNLTSVAGDLGLNIDLGGKESGAGVEWVLRSAAGFLAGGPIGALVGNTMGWRGVVTNLGVNLGVGVAAALIGLSIPVFGWIAIAATIGVAQITLGQKGIKEKIRNIVLDEMHKTLPSKMDEAGGKVEASALEQVEQLAVAIEQSGQAVLMQMEEAAAASSRAAEQDTHQRQRRIVLLRSARQRLSEIEVSLEMTP